MRMLRLIVAVSLALVCFAESALAGAFSVVPQMIELSVERRSSMVEVRNNASVETVFQVETFSWSDSYALEDLVPTREILAVPAVFRLPPGGVQTVRIAARGTPGPIASEQSYRMLVSEVPSEEQAGGVVFALRMSLPVFLKPAGAKGVLSFDVGPNGRLVRIRNSGRAHLRLREVRTVEPSSGRVLEVLPLEQPAYLLPGQTRALPLAIYAGRSAVRFEADTTGGSFQHTIGE